jgi:hypothetical protein
MEEVDEGFDHAAGPAKRALLVPQSVLASKLVWAKPSHSEMQLRDVRNLIACVPTLDWSYLERWATDLTVANLLAEVRP